MTLTLEDLTILREGVDFEAKLARGRDGSGTLPRSFWETYSAMANTRGGQIVLGVREKEDRSFEVVGIEDPDKVLKDLWDLLANQQKVSANVLAESDVRVESLEGRQVVRIQVPRAPRETLPVFINGDLLGGAFFRTHDGDRHADKERVRRWVAEAEFDSRDDRVLRGYWLDELDLDTLRAYRNVFRSVDSDHPWITLDDTEFLRQLGAIDRDTESGEEGLSLAGLLLFGRHNAIVRALPRLFLDYQERPIVDDVTHWTDRFIWDGKWSGNLFDFYRRVIIKLTADLKVPFQLVGGLQRKDETHVHEAVREALVNALIHADYEASTPLLLIKSPGEFRFRNPGTPRLAREQIRQGGVSDCRNRRLQQMFLHLGIGERAGSGFARILRAWQEQSWRAPSLTVEHEMEFTTLELTTASLLPDELVSELRGTLGARFEALSSEERVAVVTAAGEGRITNERLREVAPMHPRDATLMLRKLVDLGLLEKHGERSDAWYSSVSSSPPHSPPHSSPHSPEEASIALIRRVAGSKRVPPEAFRAAILAVCASEYRTIREIAGELNRKAVTIQQNYVTRMLQTGELEARYPDKPSHPGQAYRAT